MTGVDVAFWVLSAVAIVAGWRVFRTDSMVRASFFLLVSFVAVAGIVLLLAAPYLGAALVFMMAVEMMVMALFMVMFMMNPAGLNPMKMVHQEWVAVGAGLAAFLGVGALAVWAVFPAAGAAAPGPPPPDPIRALGIELLGDSMLVFESAGVTLLAAMVGSVVLSSARGRYGSAMEGSEPPGLVPGGEPAGRRPDSDEDDAGEDGEQGHGGAHGHGGHHHG